jgi:hypothetical protein
MSTPYNKFGDQKNNLLSSAFKKISRSSHVLKGIHPYQGLQLFLLSRYINPQMARILKASGSEIGSDNRIKQ